MLDNPNLNTSSIKYLKILILTAGGDHEGLPTQKCGGDV